MDLTYTDVLQPILFDLVKTLENEHIVKHVDLKEKVPAKLRALLFWEQKNGESLPDDLKEFYLTTNGLFLKWNAECSGRLLQLGCVQVNAIEEMKELQADLNSKYNLSDVFDEEPTQDQNDRVPSSQDKCFELSSEDNGKVCLVYKNSSDCPKVWLLDRSLRWHFLSASFRCYLRMLVIHMGLKGWHQASIEVTLNQKSWMNYFIPHRVRPSDKNNLEIKPNQVDFSALMKNKDSKEKNKALSPWKSRTGRPHKHTFKTFK